jgi:hypothetical protein
MRSRQLLVAIVFFGFIRAVVVFVFGVVTGYGFSWNSLFYSCVIGFVIGSIALPLPVLLTHRKWACIAWSTLVASIPGAIQPLITTRLREMPSTVIASVMAGSALSWAIVGFGSVWATHLVMERFPALRDDNLRSVDTSL